MSEDRQDRSDRLKRRFDRDVDEDDSETEPSQRETVEQSDADESNEQPVVDTHTPASEGTKNAEESIKDRPSVLMYLPEELHTELDIRFDELNAQYKREHGRPLEKNRDYYPAVIEASLENKSVKDILDL